ncbi:DNA-binding response regulator [Bacillus pseudomycoides]|nr:DNA-binding response regulator [Bacillus pseudomycoides]
MGKFETIMIVDDEEEIIELMTDFLSLEGYQVLQATDVKCATELFTNNKVDCILLDVMMPGEDGFSFCKKLRLHSDVPILFLSAKETDTDKIRGFTLGGDDYITKSATPSEIVARVKAVERRCIKPYAFSKQTSLIFGDFHIDVEAQSISYRNQQLIFTTTEYKILKYLAENANKVRTYDQILEQVWGMGRYDFHTVRVYIGKIREKLDAYNCGVTIETIWATGYKFKQGRTV